MKPIIAIIGRPNVGKSTLFNRLARKNKAIVIDEPGATRDRNYADCTWHGKEFTLIDTGGFEPTSSENILMQVREQTMLAMEEADIIIFLMDGKEGFTPSDRELTSILRNIKKPVLFTVNKVDGPKHEERIYDFYETGVDHIFSISAEHGYGVNTLMEHVVSLLPSPAEKQASDSDEDGIKIAVIGKPNVGKSSLVNKILGYERTLVHHLPGTTRDAIDTPFMLQNKKYVLIDTAGIRRKSRVTHVLEKYSVIQALKAIDRCDIALLLIDAGEGITEQDAKIAGLTLERGVACIIVVNKWDTVSKDNSTAGTYAKEIKEKIKFMDYAPIVFVSALTGQRIPRIFELIDVVYSQYTKRVNTSELNKVVREFLDSYPPPLYQNKPNTFSYMTQVSVSPPTFVFFVREPGALHFSYKRYLTNRLREKLGFEFTPIKLIFRKKVR